MGAVHMGRSLSPLGVYDLGNSVAEWADLHDLGSLHLAVVDRSTPVVDAAWSLPPTAWAVADLRPLRTVGPTGQSDPSISELLDLARRYDLLIMPPTLTDSPPLN